MMLYCDALKSTLTITFLQGWTAIRTDGRTDEGMDGWMDGWMGIQVESIIRKYADRMCCMVQRCSILWTFQHYFDTNL